MKITFIYRLILLMVFVPLIASAQSKTVTGTINDDLGIPLPGVTVQVKNTSNLGAVTNFDGLFTISIPSDAKKVLIFSYVGYATEEVDVSSTNKVTLNMKVDAAALDEVVVVGYGTVLKKDVTGSLSSVKVKDEVATQSASVDQLLQGRAAGVQVIQNLGAPGSGISVKIRGTSSLRGDNEPLYVIDGVIISSAGEDTDPISIGDSGGGAAQNGLNGINPRDIETMQVLKDASATAIYGSRGANGVVLITTKKGVKGKVKINAFMTSSIRTVNKQLDVLDGLGYVNYINEYQETLSFDPKFVVDDETGLIYSVKFGDVSEVPSEIYNWHDEIYRTGIGLKVGASASGATDTGNYYISAGLSDEDGIVPNSKFKAIDFRINLSQNLNKNLKLKVNVSTFFSDSNFAQGGGGTGTGSSYVKTVTSFRPVVDPLFDIDSGDDIPLEFQSSNPFSFVNDFSDISNENRYIGSLTLTYKLPVKGLSYEIKFGGNVRNKVRSRFYGLTTNKGKKSNANGYFDESTLDAKSYQLNNLIKFNRTFNKIHRFNTVFGVTYDVKTVDKSSYAIQDFLTPIFRTKQPAFASKIQKPYIFAIDNQQIFSLLGRINYTFQNKYTLTATFRRDGVSKFQSPNKYGNFPSFAFSWNAGNENFIKGLEFFDSLKLRAGWGLTGSQAIRAYETLSLHSVPTGLYGNASGGTNVPLTLSVLPNSSLTWETTEQLSFGVDFSLLKNTVSGSIDLYDKKAKDLLQRSDIAPSNGFGKLTINKGSISNKGLEVALDFTPISNDNFEFSIGGNIAINRNEITDLSGQTPNDFYINGEVLQKRFYFGNQVSRGVFFDHIANVYVEGEAVGLFYGHITDGIYQTEDTDILDGFVPGDVRIVDQLTEDTDGDGILDAGDGVIDLKDRTIIGNPNPDFVYGFNLSLKYKRLSLSALFNGVYGNDLVNANSLELGTPTGAGFRNILSQVYADAWRPDNQSNLQPRIGYSTRNDIALNDRIIEDASYLRLNNLTIGYDFSVDKIDLFDSVNIYIAGQNLFTWTDFSGYDPENTSLLRNGLIQGIDKDSAPNAKNFLLGVNVSF